MTACLQNHARLTGVPIDRLSFGFRVQDWWGPEEVAEAPAAGGVYVHGLFLEAARWGAAEGEHERVPGARGLGS